MLKRYSYIGTLKGVKGIWCDKKPRGLEVEKEVVFYVSDEDKVFVDKEGNMLDSVVIQDGIDIKDYVEIKKPKVEEDDNKENQND